MKIKSALGVLSVGAAFLFTGGCGAKVEATSEATRVPSTAKSAANVPTNPLKEAYFGEQHLHTAYSLDAYIGGARLMPSDSYRFAKGEEVEVGGVKVKLHATARLGGGDGSRRVYRRDVFHHGRWSARSRSGSA